MENQGSKFEPDEEALIETPKVRIHSHFKGFTWSWFISPLRFDGLTTIGKVIYLIGLTEFVIIGVFVIIRLLTKSGCFRRSITKDSEAYFFSTVMMCIASIIQGAHVYGNPKQGSNLSAALRVVFWIYAPIAYLFALGMYFVLFTNRHHLKAADMTPAWMLPMFPVILWL
jgi:tellurite resistance protein TehA-like permease